MQQSSSRREIRLESNHVHSMKVVGCMSGIFHLLSRRQFRRRIPSASTKEKIESPSTSSQTTKLHPDFAEIKPVRIASKPDIEILTGDNCLSRRSPTLPSEIRRSGGCFDLGDSPRRSSVVVARLMGLPDSPLQLPQVQTPKNIPFVFPFSFDSTEEKRQKLLGALERCDEDLRSLRRIIDAVRTADKLRLKDDRDSPMRDMKCLFGNNDQPSPVSVLDGISSPTFSSEQDNVKKKAWSSMELNSHHSRRTPIEGIHRPYRQLEMHRRMSFAMAENHGEVGDVAANDSRREMVRVGVELADYLAGDLVDGTVIELAELCSTISLQQRSKRKLQF